MEFVHSLLKNVLKALLLFILYIVSFRLLLFTEAYEVCGVFTFLIPTIVIAVVYFKKFAHHDYKQTGIIFLCSAVITFVITLIHSAIIGFLFVNMSFDAFALALMEGICCTVFYVLPCLIISIVCFIRSRKDLAKQV